MSHAMRGGHPSDEGGDGAANTAAKSDKRWDRGISIAGIAAGLVVGWLGAAATVGAWPWSINDAAKVEFSTPSTGDDVGERVDFTGSVEDLEPGQVIWTMARKEKDGSGQPVANSHIYASSGPCSVNGDDWSCSGIGLGASGPDGAGQYTVWVTVLDEKQAFNVVESLRHQDGDQGITSEPPSITKAAIDELTLTRE